MRAEILVLFQSDVVWHNILTFDKNDFLVNLKEEYNQSWRVPMPTLSMFFGIIIRMQSERRKASQATYPLPLW